jgi:flagellar protein FliS
MKTGYQKYKTTSVQSASKEKILLMLYEGCIRFMKQAMVAIDKKDIAERGMNIGRAYDIVMELMNTLNFEAGGDLAKELERLYMFVTDQLTQANIKNDRVPLGHALKTMETLYSGWVEAIEKLKREEVDKG